MDPCIIVLALGAAVIGGPEALRLLLNFAGQSPLADIAVCIYFIGMVTAHVLGVLLLTLFVRKTRAQAAAGGGAAPRAAPATDFFAKMTLTVSVGVAFLTTACLVFVPGGLGSARVVFDIAGKIPAVTVVVLLIGAAGALPFIMPLLFGTDNADGGAPAALAAERSGKLMRMVSLAVICFSFTLAYFLVVSDGGKHARTCSA